MAIRLEDKQQIVSEVNQAASSALSAVLADYRGVSVEDMTALRKNARENKVYLRVVRNTLLKRAVADTEFECIQEVLVGPTSVFSGRSGCSCTGFEGFCERKRRFRNKGAVCWWATHGCQPDRCVGETADAGSGAVYAHECHAGTCH